MEALSRKLKEGGEILVVQTAFLGDVILVTPLLRAIRTSFPNAKVTALVIPQCAEIVQGWVDRTITVDKRAGDTDVWTKVAQNLSEFHFEAAFIPHRSTRSALFARRLGIPIRIGFNYGSGRYFHTHTANYSHCLYEGKRNLSLLKAATDFDDTGLPEVKVTPEQENKVSEILDEIGFTSSRFVTIAPGSVWETKKWPAAHYRRLVEILLTEYGIRTLAIGGRNDSTVCAEIVKKPEFNFAGRLSPLESAAIMRRSCMVVSGDTAPAHLATAVGVRQVIVFGSTSLRFGFAPMIPTCRPAGLEMWCRPCTDHGKKKCPRFASPNCLNDLTAEHIIRLTNDWLTE